MSSISRWVVAGFNSAGRVEERVEELKMSRQKMEGMGYLKVERKCKELGMWCVKVGLGQARPGLQKQAGRTLQLLRGT